MTLHTGILLPLPCSKFFADVSASGRVSTDQWAGCFNLYLGCRQFIPAALRCIMNLQNGHKSTLSSPLLLTLSQKELLYHLFSLPSTISTRLINPLTGWIELGWISFNPCLANTVNLYRFWGNCQQMLSIEQKISNLLPISAVGPFRNQNSLYTWLSLDSLSSQANWNYRLYIQPPPRSRWRFLGYLACVGCTQYYSFLVWHSVQVPTR